MRTLDQMSRRHSVTFLVLLLVKTLVELAPADPKVPQLQNELQAVWELLAELKL